jgi:hypothetical protein
LTGKTGNESSECLRELKETVFSSDKFVVRKRSRYISFENAIELAMVLPGRVAKETRTQFANIIRRYLAGDHSLIQEIHANAQSASPIAQMARESLGIMTDEDMIRKRRREQLEIDKLEADIQNSRLVTQQKSVEEFIKTMECLDPDWKKDTRLVVQTKDRLKNIVLGPQASITNGQDSQALPLSIQELARELGYGTLGHGDLCKIGKKAIELYRAEHDRAPPKRLQYVDGAERLVNAYTEADRDLLVRAVEAVMPE